MFEGVYTALVTPFDRDGKVDVTAYRNLIEYQIAEGVDGIIPCGSTGESSTLSQEEHHEVIRSAISIANKRVKVIAGTGGNSTNEALVLTRHAQAAGADGALQVTPYYNKPNREGLLRHFTEIANVGLPIMLYNIPGRSVRELSVDLVSELSEHPNIVAIKEAGGSIDRVYQLKQACSIEILSGDDPLSLPMMMLGAVGVVSVVSNIIPGAISKMIHYALQNQWNEAIKLYQDNYSLFSALLGLDTNPIPIKTALSFLGKTTDVFRLPLCKMEDGKMEILKDILKNQKLL